MASPAILCLCFFFIIFYLFRCFSFQAAHTAAFGCHRGVCQCVGDLAGAAEEVPHGLARVPRQPGEQTRIKISVAGAPSPLSTGTFIIANPFTKSCFFLMQPPLCWFLLQRLQQAGAQDGSCNVLGSARKRYLRSKPASAGAAGVSDPILSTKVSRKT